MSHDIIVWCHVFDDHVHAGDLHDGWLTTLVYDEENALVCFKQTEIEPADLRPWRDRALLGVAVCQRCEQDVSLTAELIEAHREDWPEEVESWP